MNKAFQQEQEKSIRKSALRLVALLDQNAPDVIICNEVAMLISMTTQLHGEILGARLGEMLKETTLSANGRCQKCGARCGGAIWCEHCDAKVDTELRDIGVDPDAEGEDDQT